MTAPTAEEKRPDQAAQTARAPADPREEADYWRARYQQERERLAKLWVAYKALEAELAKVPEPNAG